MKVLFIGVYRDGTGWGQAAVDYILAMDAAGIDVVCRPVKLNSAITPIPERVIELEQKPLKGANICIQNVLPHLMDYNGHFDKNIGLYFTETDSFSGSTWPQRINSLDEAWVCCNQMKEASINSGVDIPIKIVPCATDVEKFEVSRPTLPIPDIEETFCFYFIGDMIRRKNLVALLKAFHLEFGVNEPASLFIKTTKEGLTPEETLEHVKEMCRQIKENLKIYPSIEDYKYELIATDHITEQEMYSMHCTCDCLVMPSYGEAWGIPALDAMGFGNTPICSSVGGPLEYIGGGGQLVDVRAEPVFGMVETFNDIYTGNENWWSIDINGLRKAMRHVFELWKNDPDAYQAMRKAGQEDVKKYSYETVGKIIKELLENAS
jgi:glycosyltransferase involved in cell wall biosynthesis